MEGASSRGYEKRCRYQTVFEAQLRQLVQNRCQDGNFRIKIVLGGTLFSEVRYVADTLSTILHEKFEKTEEDPTPDITFDEWLQKWDVEIVGYSINTSFLADIKQRLDKSQISPFFRERTRLEYIDLMDPAEWPRIAEEAPDIIFTVSSLYVSEAYDDWSQKADREKNQKLALKLWYTDFAMRILPAGGMFLTEGLAVNVIPHPENVTAIMLEGGLFSGLFIKDATPP
jgi:hypothetical protein